ncbi:hypothetical protein GCM10023178_15150 [Actinomadura luteofluorescens]
MSKGPHPANMSLRLANESTGNRRDTLTSGMQGDAPPVGDTAPLIKAAVAAFENVSMLVGGWVEGSRAPPWGKVDALYISATCAGLSFGGACGFARHDEFENAAFPRRKGIAWTCRQVSGLRCIPGEARWPIKGCGIAYRVAEGFIKKPSIVLNVVTGLTCC